MGIASLAFNSLPSNVQRSVRTYRGTGRDMIYYKGSTPPSGTYRATAPTYTGYSPRFKDGFRGSMTQDVLLISHEATAPVVINRKPTGTTGGRADDGAGFDWGSAFTSITEGLTSALGPSGGGGRTTESYFVPTRAQIPWGLVGIGGLALAGLLVLRKKGK